MHEKWLVIFANHEGDEQTFRFPPDGELTSEMKECVRRGYRFVVEVQVTAGEICFWPAYDTAECLAHAERRARQLAPLVGEDMRVAYERRTSDWWHSPN